MFDQKYDIQGKIYVFFQLNAIIFSSKIPRNLKYVKNSNCNLPYRRKEIFDTNYVDNDYW